MTASAIGSVAEIRRYPVKSLAGERIAVATLDRAGVPGDRRLALRDVTTGKILSAKTPGVGTALLECGARLGADGRVRITVGPTEVTTDDPRRVHTVLAEHLDRPVRLERAVTGDDVYESYWPPVEGLALSDVTTDFPIALATEKTAFVDLAALHVIASSSLDHLAKLLPDAAITVDRFRPSIVIDSGTASPFVENSWTDRTARLGDATIAFSVATPRCVMTTLPQHGLPRASAVLPTLARENRVTMEGLGDFACLGVYAEVVEPGTVRVGDQLRLD